MAYANFASPVLLLPTVLAANNLDSTIVDAADESVFTIGQVYLEGGPSSSSKTLSTSGGGIYYSAFSTTFANAGTTLRFGIQGIDAATGLNNGTFTVYGDLVGGTDTISFNQHKFIGIDSGSVSLSHGDYVALGMKVVSRGGTDSLTVVTPTRYMGAGGMLFPYAVINGTTKTAPYATFGISFDDGTVGWISGVGHTRGNLQSDSYNTSSAYDEYGIVFQIPFGCQVAGFMFADNFNSSPDSTWKLYSDPTGTPVEMASLTHDGNLLRSTGSTLWTTFLFDTEYPIAADTDYCISRLATSTTSVTWSYADFPDNTGFLKQSFVPTNAMYHRDGSTGAFSFVRSTGLYSCIGLLLSSSEIPSGGGVPYVI